MKVRPAVPALGPCHLGDGEWRFRLWAPDARRVDLLLDGRELPMQPECNGCHCVDAFAEPGARYLYRIDGGAEVPDPASRWQPEGVHGPSALWPGGSYAWKHADWNGRPWEEAIIYEVHVGACGGYAGLREQLPRLAGLGITAIELMPLAQFAGTRNWGYDGVLAYAPAQAYGTPDELKALVDEAHGLGLMVLLDVVYNHFGPDGNHLGGYASGFFHSGSHTPWGEAIDFAQPAVQRYFIDNALMWLREYRFDGLRLDAVHAIESPDFLDRLRDAVAAANPEGRQLHLVLENEHNQASLLQHGYTAQWNDDFHNALHVLLTGETEGYYADYAGTAVRHLARVLAEGLAWQGETTPRGRVRGEPSVGLPPCRFVVFAQNHDQIGNRAQGERLASLLAPQRLRVAMALTALTPMVPLFFMGEPWAAREPFLFFTDFSAPLDEAVREGRRREFAHFAAYADPQARQAIPDPNAVATFRASRAPWPEPDDSRGQAWLAWFQELLALRRRELVPVLPRVRSLGAQVIGEAAIAAGWDLGGEQWWLEFNLGPGPVAGSVPEGQAVFVLGVEDGHTRLPPDSLRIRKVVAA
jgi:maltooligosyltrehalose trehalohydrolase